MKKSIQLKNESELLEFINKMNTFDSPIDICKGSHCVDAKSVLGVIALGMYDILDLTLMSADEDEQLRFAKEIKKYEVVK